LGCLFCRIKNYVTNTERRKKSFIRVDYLIPEDAQKSVGLTKEEAEYLNQVTPRTFVAKETVEAGEVLQILMAANSGFAFKEASKRIGKRPTYRGSNTKEDLLEALLLGLRQGIYIYSTQPELHESNVLYSVVYTYFQYAMDRALMADPTGTIKSAFYKFRQGVRTVISELREEARIATKAESLDLVPWPSIEAIHQRYNEKYPSTNASLQRVFLAVQSINAEAAGPPKSPASRKSDDSPDEFDDFTENLGDVNSIGPEERARYRSLRQHIIQRLSEIEVTDPIAVQVFKMIYGITEVEYSEEESLDLFLKPLKGKELNILADRFDIPTSKVQNLKRKVLLILREDLNELYREED